MEQRFTHQKRKCKIDLKFDEEYTIWFESDGQMTKKVAVSTKNVPEFMKMELLDFAFVVDLRQPPMLERKKLEGSLVAKWFFHTDMGEFDFHRARKTDDKNASAASITY